MSIDIIPSGQSCGAEIHGVDLRNASDSEIADIRRAWLDHHVIAFPDQDLTDDDLVRVAQYFGDLGEDPFFGKVAGQTHVAAILREADEKSPLFADNWHTDWSFMANPPIGTLLYGVDIPTQGGDTLFANQHMAWAQMPDEMRAKYADLIAVHSAKLAYAKDGAYGEDDTDSRSMDIRPSDDAKAEQPHPLILNHPETGSPAIYSTMGYIIGIEGMEMDKSFPLLAELAAWQGREAFIYTHKWQKNMLVLWDNRSVLHKATGGYEGQRRELHRVTIY